MKLNRKPNLCDRVEGRFPTIGYGPFKFQWYSICSRHFHWQYACGMCMAGTWTNIWLLAVSGWFHDNHYPLWYWWANHKNKKAK